MEPKLLNDFLLGADPELVLLDPPTLVNGMTAKTPASIRGGEEFYGFDHNGFVVEPHPKPSRSAREVCRNIKASLDVIAYHFGDYKQRAGAYIASPERAVTLGGHVHLDMPRLTPDQVGAMDTLCESLERLDILPDAENQRRMANGGGRYGRKGDVRAERGRVEYRSMCSWLFSRKATMLSITGVKLCALAPNSVKKMRSIKDVVKWLEGFKGADDDVDWILDRGYFDTSMEARPDTNVQTIWKADPAKGKELIPKERVHDWIFPDHLREAIQRAQANAQANAANLANARQARPAQNNGLLGAYPGLRGPLDPWDAI